jgi:hypothetical protein
MYRIIRETIHNKTQYKVQKRFLLLWWITQSVADIRYSHDPNFLSFTTVEQAEEYIRMRCTKKETKIVKYIKL